jgi:hypothetical protein
VVEAGTLRFEVEKAKIVWGAFLRDLGRWNPATASQFENYSGKGPSVVVHNANGEKRVLEVTTTVKEARDRATAIEHDFKTRSTAEWCERYDVPVTFVTG